MIPVIGLDARMVGPTPSGLGTYARELARALVARDPRTIFVVIRRADSLSPIVEGANVRDAVIASPLDAPGNLMRGGEISRLGLDLYHSLHHFVPLALRVPRVVVTLHDLIWIEHRDLIVDGRFGALNRAATHVYARAAMRLALGRADRVIAVSAYSASRAAAWLRWPLSQIAVVHHGVDAGAYPPARTDAPARPPFFLVLGNTRPYKNVPAALHAFAIVARTHRDAELVVAGRGDSVRQLQPLAQRLGIARRVRFPGPVSHAELLALLHGATALVFPSFVEGFGLPVLEAMAAGCPVVASTAPTLTEVAGDAALFCDPRDPAAFASAMGMLVDDAERRLELGSRGRARAAEFTWLDAADRTLAVYRALLGRGSGK